VSTAIVVLFFVAAGLTAVLVGMRAGRKGPFMDSQGKGGRRAVAWLTALAVLLFAVAIPVVVSIDDSDSSAQAGPVDLNATEEEGRQVFAEHCVQCHTLGASNSVQTVGPNLDVLRPPKELTLDAIEKGRARGQGQMPALLVTGEDAEAVASYVAKVAGRDQ
jgi:mono/diheme cytochrome c family protein